MSEQTISEGKVVSFKYTLTVDGQQVETSGDEALPYLQGAGNVVPGLEEAMEGRTAGDSFTTTIPPEKGYGEKSEADPQPIPRENFPDEVQPGMPFLFERPDGSKVPLWVTSVSEEQVFVEPDHPLAGQTLNFDIDIVEVRDATEEEVAHGHVHGPGGHQH